MKPCFAEVSGITPSAHFPKCPHGHPFTQLCEIDKLCIPCPNPSIRDVLEVCVEVVICSTKEIGTPVGRKLVIEGRKQIKINFSTEDKCHSVHIAHFEIPFCAFILLGDSKREIKKVCTAVEHVSVQCLDSRCLTVTSIIFICPEFKKQHDDCPCPPDDHDDNCHCACNDPCSSSKHHNSNCDHPFSHSSWSDCCQPTWKKYQSGSLCPGCGLPRPIRADQRHYYGK